MRTFLKIFAGVVIVLVVLFVVAAVLFSRFFDPNAFKGQIAAAVKESTGRELVIPGQIELSYFPWLGFEVGEVRLGNPPGFGDGPFAIHLVEEMIRPGGDRHALERRSGAR